MIDGMYIRNWFSNMMPFDDPLIEDDIEYNSVENYYQAHKTLDMEERKRIACLPPKKSKTEGRKLVYRDDWNLDKKKEIMLIALKHKFRTDTTWGQQLLQTEGDIIEYNNWGDTTWGVDINTGNGSNHLGKLLMQIRNELQLSSIFS